MNRANDYISPQNALLGWPVELPVLHLAGTGRFQYIAASFTAVDFALTQSISLQGNSNREREKYSQGYFGLLSYNNQAPNLLFRVDSYLCFDTQERTVSLTSPLHGKSQYSLTEQDLNSILNSTHHLRHEKEEYSNWELDPRISDSEYLQMIEKALEEIRCGRFYQINLLRFYQLLSAPTRRELLHRLASKPEPFSAYVETEDLTVATFSPERFVRIENEGAVCKAQTWPIKGTAPRHSDPIKDKESAAELVDSAKDQAELHMIVDLMRNDLSRISKQGSIKVTDPGTLQSFNSVHHLVATVESQIASETTLSHLFNALTPAGSITGAPKHEVMQAIEEYERRDRGYFMGNIFVLDDAGFFDSSILIRTLVKRKSKPYEFAAGSGIVIQSDPKLEMAEVSAKGRVITAPW